MRTNLSKTFLNLLTRFQSVQSRILDLPSRLQALRRFASFEAITFTSSVYIADASGNICWRSAFITCSYLAIILLNKGTAIASITEPKTIITIMSVEIADAPAPNTRTLRIASTAYVSGKILDISCINQGICCIGKNTPLKNIIGKTNVIINSALSLDP